MDIGRHHLGDYTGEADLQVGGDLMEPYVPDTLPLNSIDWAAHVPLIDTMVCSRAS